MTACTHEAVKVALDFESAVCGCGAVWRAGSGWTVAPAAARERPASKLSQPCGGACVAGCTACQREREVRP